MKLINKSKNGLSHTLIEDKKPVYYVLNRGEVKDIPEEIAKIWTKIEGVEEYVEPADLEKAKAEAEEKAEAEKKAMQEEIDKLKAELEKAKATKPAKSAKK